MAPILLPQLHIENWRCCSYARTISFCLIAHQLMFTVGYKGWNFFRDQMKVSSGESHVRWFGTATCWWLSGRWWVFKRSGPSQSWFRHKKLGKGTFLHFALCRVDLGSKAGSLIIDRLTCLQRIDEILSKEMWALSVFLWSSLFLLVGFMVPTLLHLKLLTMWKSLLFAILGTKRKKSTSLRRSSKFSFFNKLWVHSSSYALSPLTTSEVEGLNNLVIKSQAWNASAIFSEIQMLSYLWISDRCQQAQKSWALWLIFSLEVGWFWFGSK